MIIDPYTWHRLEILRIQPVAKDTVAVYLLRPADYHFRAGQYAVVRVTSDANTWVRQYSFASAPEASELCFLIQREPGGAVSNWFFSSASNGMAIEISESFGNFVPDLSQQSVFIAGKVGVAPFISVLSAHSSAGKLYYCVREEEELCTSLLPEATNLHACVTTTGTRLGDSELKTIVAMERPVYVCGSKLFVDGLSQRLQKLGQPTELLHKELFTLE